MSGPSIDNDAFFIDLPPLPAGWDWQRYRSLQPGELSALPDAEQSLIRAHQQERLAQWYDIRGADEVAASRLSQLQLRRAGLLPSKPGTTAAAPAAAAGGEHDDHLTPDERAVVERFGLPFEEVGTPLFEIAEVMHRKGCEYWGFMAFRVWGYESAAGQARSHEFWQRWGKMINDRLSKLAVNGIKNTGLRDEDEGFEARFKEMYDAAMTGGILPRWQLIIKEHEALNGLGPQEVREDFRAMLKLDDEEDESMPNRVPIGVDPGLCLMVDEGVVSSLLDEREGKRPYIIGVLSDIDDQEVADDAEALHFKIALESVVDLWRQIQVQSVMTLLPPEGKIYISPGVFEDDD
ncbi:hypothetical protein QBC46DRAFT_452560 [Diplogelasinospora grovesii]|uniref:Uncharacterized protein n=1 Tax=Diplogelasinospora grovesii TaxID=303347 RepID=A0AAN6N0B3_9PEZI|nr:hypothetical protein QBC46DRAFT_452560 [Diplogelasinospora grovesii]